MGSCGTTHVAGLFFPERTFGKDNASRDLSFAIWGPERREQCQVCSVLTLLALRTSLAISAMGQEACRGLWTQNAPQCQLCVCGLLVVVLIECIALEKGYKHSAFATNIILSSTVRVGAGPPDPSGPSQSPCSLWAGSQSEAVKTQPLCDPYLGVTSWYPSIGAGCSGGEGLWRKASFFLAGEYDSACPKSSSFALGTDHALQDLL